MEFLSIKEAPNSSAYMLLDDSDDSKIHVAASVQTYTYTDGKFVPATNEKRALEIKYASGRISEFAATTEFDNTKSRFTLLTVQLQVINKREVYIYGTFNHCRSISYTVFDFVNSDFFR